MHESDTSTYDSLKNYDCEILFQTLHSFIKKENYKFGGVPHNYAKEPQLIVFDIDGIILEKNDYEIKKCGHLGNIAATEMITHYGARPQKKFSELLIDYKIKL